MDRPKSEGSLNARPAISMKLVELAFGEHGDAHRHQPHPGAAATTSGTLAAD